MATHYSIKNDSNIVGETGSLLVAANNAITAEKNQANVTGGGVCDNTNDEVQLAAADAACNYGIVTLSSGSFEIDAALALDNGGHLVGKGCGDLGWGTRLNISGTDYGITLTPSGNYMGGVHNLTIHTPASFATAALTVDNNGTDIRGRHILSRLALKAYHAGVGEGTPDITSGGIGINFLCTSGFNQNVFETIYITGFQKCMQVYINETADTWYYMNGNFFNWWTLAFGQYLMYFDINAATGYNQGDFAFNMFTGLILEPSTVHDLTDYGIYAVGTGYGRFWGSYITQFICWDCDYIDTNVIYLDNNCPNNYIEGAWKSPYFTYADPWWHTENEPTVVDNGSNNVLTTRYLNGDIL